MIKKNWIKRALRTFVQAAVGYVYVALPAGGGHIGSTRIGG